MSQDNTVRAKWVAAFEASGLSQDAFEQEHGLPARTLRSWRRKFRASRQPPAGAVREVVERAIEALAAVRASLDAACQQPASGEAVSGGSGLLPAEVAPVRVLDVRADGAGPGPFASPRTVLLSQPPPPPSSRSAGRLPDVPPPSVQSEVEAHPIAIRRSGYFDGLQFP